MAVNLHTVAALKNVRVRDGVVLRPLEEGDAADILRILAADPSIRERVVMAARMHSEADVAKEVADYRANDGSLRLVIVQDGRCVGHVAFWRDGGYFGHKADPNAYGFGYFLDPAVRGSGLAADCVRALMKVAQDNLRVDAFIGFCEDDNPGSIATLRKVGLEPTDLTFTDPTYGWVERRYEKRVKA